ncbi:zinc-binding alcohol dehydrogenase family protein [Actinoplanes auranticolor]|uniref:Zinc-type alcohol dehydrogenase-like protein n=1 Tax=Actinoplanes auranticolor TaxID=47988 RepID=A0A919SIB2_9ACTN|nr:zinc-binding alcohol dehydrogenase family protein [Actinoplanes auranticolor]GIM72455.1 NADPH:quinone reductase [Actinoplanes auranticolor]
MAELMRAVGYRRNLPISDPASLLDLELPVPSPGEHDLLVRVEAVSVNPVDVKVRAGSDPGGDPKILGYDAAGVVVAVGSAVTLFQPGDEVWYAGSIARSGTDAQFHLVDERITGPKPASLDFAEAAALPLTTLTAWEALFDRLRLTAASTGTLLVLGAAGGVGSILVQLARRLTGLEVVGTASRPESQQYVLDRGAHRVVNHHDDLAAALPGGVDYVFSPHSDGMVDTFAQILRPYGAVVAIDEPAGLDLRPLKSKSIAWHWELMFTRALYDPASTAQHDILRQAAELVDQGVLHTTLTERIDGITAEHLRRAHGIVERGSAIGKTVLAGF